MKRKFADLEAYEALHVAIFIEERNARIYERFAQQFAESSDEESQAIAATFREMADEELGHGSRLQELHYQYFKNQPCSLTDADIEEVIEVPQLQGAEPFLAGAPNRRWALEAALTGAASKTLLHRPGPADDGGAPARALPRIGPAGAGPRRIP